MTKWIFLFSLFSCVAFAENLNLSKVHLVDQHEVKSHVDESTHWILFTADMDGYKMVKETLEALGVEDIKAKGGYFVADISKMPKMISKMFAIPAMKKFKFKIQLDGDGELTKDWPREERKLTVMKLKAGEVTEVTYLKDKAALEEFWKSLK